MKQEEKTINNKNNKVSNRIERANRSILIQTLIVFLPISVLIFSISLVILITQENLEMKVYMSTEKSIVNTKLENIETEINHVMDDLLIQTLNSGIEEIWENGDNTEIIEALSKDFLNIVAYHKIYDQIRLIDEDGEEVIRVNFNDGYPMVVPQQELQNKKDRYYFSDTFKRNKNEVFVSPLDLNIEDGMIEQPIKPMMRFGAPVFDKRGVKRGIVLLNYFGQTVLNQFEDCVNSTIESQVMLLNANGYWLKGSIPENEWGFMYEDKKNITFSSLYSDAWSIIENEEASQFETQEGLFTFKTIYPLLEGQKSYVGADTLILTSDKESISRNYNWKIVSYVPSDVLYDKRNERRQYFTLLLAFLSASLFTISFRLAKAQYYRRKALESLKVSNETKDKFFSIISHDLRSPFNSLLCFTNMLVENYDSFDDEERKFIIESLNTSSKNTYQLLENLLTWSCSQTGRIEFAPEEIKIKTVIDDIILLCQPSVENKNIGLIDNTKPDLSVCADKNMLHTILQNLIMNAIKFTPQDGSVHVSAKPSTKTDFIEITVSDTGIGISDHIIDELFLIDKNVSTLGTEEETGTGLGLILCKEFIEKQGGEIWVESEVGKGSQFIFTLPWVCEVNKEHVFSV